MEEGRKIKGKGIRFLFLFMAFSAMPLFVLERAPAWAAKFDEGGFHNTAGVYGAPSVSGMTSEKREELIAGLSGIDAVFVPPEEETIGFFKSRGFRVVVSMNVFGGTGAWAKYPDARPVLSDGGLISKETGGICPTQEEWRAERLRAIGDVMGRLGGSGGIDGIWLDFIRYPGVWEKRDEDLEIPDACYGARDLEKFEKDTGIALPSGISDTAEAASWIKENRPYEWMAWKKEQVLSFVREVKRIRDGVLASQKEGGDDRFGALASRGSAGSRSGVSGNDGEGQGFRGADGGGKDKESGKDEAGCGDVEKVCEKEGGGALDFGLPVPDSRLESSLLLGVFLAPWTRGEKDGALSFLLGQDAFALADMVDVISPMVYHRMVGKPVDWVGRMTAYYAATAGAAVWPIIQSEDVGAEEFSLAVRVAALGGAQGVLSYSFRGMDPQKTAALAAFAAPENLIPDPGFTQPGESWKPQGKEEAAGYSPRYLVKSSAELLPPDGKGGKDSPVQTPFRALGVLGGTARKGEWRVSLQDCQGGETYRLSGLFLRGSWHEPTYAAVNLWGETFRLDKYGARPEFQSLDVRVTCPEDPGENVLQFINPSTRDFFYFGKPKLVRTLPDGPPVPGDGFFHPRFFPIGVYGAGIGDMEEIRKLAINTVIAGGEGEGLRKALQAIGAQGLHYVLSTPHDPERLKVYLDRLVKVAGAAEGDLLAFYVEDEPELRGVPRSRLEDNYRLLKNRFPRAATGMALIRPSYSRDYHRATDFFMIDNYPFPNMPMTWLSDSMDRAAREVGRDRLLAVIQAFREGEAWPSLPGWRQMDNLAFLSIVHGSRGIFFYTWSVMGKTAEGRANLGRVVGRLNKIYPWLLEKNLDRPVKVEMLSEYRVDPKGRPAVHGAVKRKGDELMVMAVNTIGAPVEVRLEYEGLKDGEALEAFSEAVYPVRRGGIRTVLQAYETKCFIVKK